MGFVGPSMGEICFWVDTIPRIVSGKSPVAVPDIWLLFLSSHFSFLGPQPRTWFSQIIPFRSRKKSIRSCLFSSVFATEAIFFSCKVLFSWKVVAWIPIWMNFPRFEIQGQLLKISHTTTNTCLGTRECRAASFEGTSHFPHSHFQRMREKWGYRF